MAFEDCTCAAERWGGVGGLACDGLDDDGGSVAEDFDCAGAFAADLAGFVAEADDGVGAGGGGVVDEEFVGLLACLLAHLGV